MNNMLKNFFSRIRSSFYDPNFYNGVKSQPLKQALYFLLGLCVIGALAISIKVAVVFTPMVKDFLDGSFLNSIPAELEVVIKDGKASTNVFEPYYISVDGKEESTEKFKNILVIDRSGGDSIDLLEKHRAFAVLTETRLFVQKESGSEIRVLSLSNFPNMTISRESVAGLLQKYRVYAYPVMALGLVVAIVGITLFSFGFYAFMLLLFALAVLIIAKVKKVSLSYAECYKIGAFAIGPAIVADVIKDILGIHQYSWWLLFSLFVIVVFLNVQKEEESKE